MIFKKITSHEFMKVSLINNSFISDLSTNSDTDNRCFISYFLFCMSKSEPEIELSLGAGFKKAKVE